MSDQTWPPTPSDGNDDAATPQSPAEPPAAPSYPSEPAPPAAPSPVDPYGQSPADPYTPPPADPYTPPAAPYTPPAAPYTPPPADPYAQPYTPPPSAPYTPPPADPYQQPGYGQPAAYGQPPSDPYQQAGYGQPAGGYQTPPPGYPPAPVSAAGALVDWPKRALGGLVDYVAPSIIISVLANVVGNVTSSGLGGVVSAVLGIGWWIYLGYKSGTTGVTFGRSLAKTKLVSEQTGQPIGVSNGIVRQLAHLVDSIICYIGWLFPLWDSKRQTLADKIMKTVVIDNSADPNAGNYDWNIQR